MKDGSSTIQASNQASPERAQALRAQEGKRHRFAQVKKEKLPTVLLFGLLAASALVADAEESPAEKLVAAIYGAPAIFLMSRRAPLNRERTPNCNRGLNWFQPQTPTCPAKSMM
jgi:hypothetical protein